MNVNVIILLSLLFSATVFAQNPYYNSSRGKAVIRGYDTVAYFDLKPGDKAVKGKKEFSYIWGKARWLFSSQENLDKFKVDPEKYTPEYGGYCAFALGKNFTTSIRPNSWQIYKGKLYLNHNKSSFKYFNKNIDKRIALADANWPSALKVCEARNNCRKPPKLD